MLFVITDNDIKIGTVLTSTMNKHNSELLDQKLQALGKEVFTVICVITKY